MSTALFEAPLPTAAGYAGVGRCALCAVQVPHSFWADNLDILVTCPTCGEARGLRAGFANAEACGNCQTALTCPVQAEEARICVSCLEGGRATFCHSTEAGHVDWTGLDSPVRAEDRLPPSCLPTRDEPVAQPAQPRDTSSFALTGPDQGWVARGPTGEPTPETAPDAEEVEKLRRTPRPSTWQDLTWPVCCNAFAVFCGEWSRTEFVAAANGEEEAGRALFVGAIDAEEAHFWDNGVLREGGALVFFCRLCRRRRVVLDYS